MKQDQFLNVIDRDEAERRFRSALDLRPLDAETALLAQALGRVLAADVAAPVDVPSFDRSNVDGFALSAADTYDAGEEQPRRVRLTGETLAPGQPPQIAIRPGWATPIATGAMIPRGADAVLMVEHTDFDDGVLRILRPLAPGVNVSFAGTDIGRGENVLRRGQLLTSRDTGVLAALGIDRLEVVRRPRVAILSTGNELIAPGQAMRPGLVYDSNAVILADAVRELGGEPHFLGIFPDEFEPLLAGLHNALQYDVVLLSGGTSKGEGDISYRAVAALGPPGILVHGVALKPGKPLCLAAVRAEARLPLCPTAVGAETRLRFSETESNPATSIHRTIPIVVLPGFPTSAIFTFHEFVAPVILALAGRHSETPPMLEARLPMRVNSERGRTEYLLVGLVSPSPSLPISPSPPLPGRDVGAEGDLIAYPMGKGSGSVTSFSRADGFVIIPRQQEYLDQGALVQVHLLGKDIRPADLVVIGSHCVGLDLLLGKLHEQGLRTKFLAVGSTAGLEAARRGECDLAGVHLLDPASGEYNRPFLSEGLELIEGYRRLQGIVFRGGDDRFQPATAVANPVQAALANAVADPACIMVNRNRGSGTRILMDQLLEGAHPPGYTIETRSHNAVVAAVVQGRADWGLAIETVAREAGLGFIPVQEEHFDFVMPESRGERPAARTFRDLLMNERVRQELHAMGFQ